MNGLDICVSIFLGSLCWALSLTAARRISGTGLKNRIWSSRNEKILEKTLPEVLERIAGGLSAGFSLQQSLEAVERSNNKPSTRLFSSILAQVKTGKSLAIALEEAGDRFSRRSLPLALHTMAQSQRSGGNLIESLNLLARISRDRESVRNRISAMSAQCRLQGVVLCLVPTLFMAGLSIANPQSLSLVLGSSTGRTILFLALGLQVAGGGVIARMVSKELF